MGFDCFWESYSWSWLFFHAARIQPHDLLYITLLYITNWATEGWEKRKKRDRRTWLIDCISHSYLHANQQRPQLDTCGSHSTPSVLYLPIVFKRWMGPDVAPTLSRFWFATQDLTGHAALVAAATTVLVLVSFSLSSVLFKLPLSSLNLDFP